MADCLYPPVFSKVEHTVYTGAHGHASGIRVRHSKAVEGRSGVTYKLLGYDLLAVLVRDHDGIPVCIQFIFQMLFTLGEHPVHAI